MITQIGGSVARKLKGEMQTAFTDENIDYTVGLQIVDPFQGYVYENEEYFPEPQAVPFETQFFPDELAAGKWKKQKKWATKRDVKDVTDSVNNLHTKREAIEWRAGLKVTDPLQLYTFENKDYLPKSSKVPFTTVGSTIDITYFHQTAKNNKPYFQTVKDMIDNITSVHDYEVVSTKGLRKVGDGGGKDYMIYPANDYIGKPTSYPNEFGDIALSDGRFAKLKTTSVNRRIKWWAHRGGQRGVLENTLVACSQAINSGAYGLEIDACMSSDGVWYVYHDSDLSVLTTGTGNFWDRDSTYINSLTFKRAIGTRYASTAKIPRLSDYLELSDFRGIPTTIEFKYPRPTSREEDLRNGIRMITAQGNEDNWHVQTTTDATARIIREESAIIKISFSLASLNNADNELPALGENFGNVIIQISSKTADTPQFKHGVDLANALGMDVISYTEKNTEEDVERLLNSGVYNIMTDRGWGV